MRMIVATHNRKKLAELERILAPLGVEPVTGEDIGILLDEVEETGTTFEENAFLKADAACRQTGMPAVADDSGLMVDALDGRPGVYSARYAGEAVSYTHLDVYKRQPLDGDKVYNFDKKRPLFTLYPLAPVTQGQSFIHLLINYRGGNMYGTGNNPAAGRRPLRL